MRPPRFRTRTLMVAVAVVAVLLGAGVKLRRRREHFAAMADTHEAMTHAGGSVFGGPEERERAWAWFDKRYEFDKAMAEKYRRAARYPFLPVPPDPPEPKWPPE